MPVGLAELMSSFLRSPARLSGSWRLQTSSSGSAGDRPKSMRMLPDCPRLGALGTMPPLRRSACRGSPVFYGSGEVVLMGIQSSMDPSYAYYSPVNWVDSALGVTPCLSPTCN